MKTMKSLYRAIVTISAAVALGISTTGMASAAEVENTQPIRVSSVHVCNNATAAIPPGYSLEEIDAELTSLSNLPDEEQDRLIQEGLGLKPKQERIAPLVIVAALGCAIGVGGAIFNTNWSSASSVAWSLAGALVSCIPGASQAKLVSVILKHRVVIAKALKIMGATAAAAALLTGSSSQP